MNKKNFIILTVAVLVIVLVWYYNQYKIDKTKQENLDNLNTIFGDVGISFATGNEVLGCTDPTAQNYNSSANMDDGDCFYNGGCCDPQASNYKPDSDSCNQPQNNEITCQYNQSNTQGFSAVITGNKTPCDPSCKCTGIFATGMFTPSCCCAVGSFRDTSRYIY